MTRKTICVLIAVAFLLCAASAFADNKITLTVTWKGIPAAGVTLKINGKSTNADITGTAKVSLAPGKYKVEVLAAGIQLGKKTLNVKSGKTKYKIKL